MNNKKTPRALFALALSAALTSQFAQAEARAVCDGGTAQVLAQTDARIETLEHSIAASQESLEDRKLYLKNSKVAAVEATLFTTEGSVLATDVIGLLLARGAFAVFAPKTAGDVLESTYEILGHIGGAAAGLVAPQFAISGAGASDVSPTDFETRVDSHVQLISEIRTQMTRAREELAETDERYTRRIKAKQSLLHLGWDGVEEIQLMVTTTEAFLKADRLERQLLIAARDELAQICR